MSDLSIRVLDVKLARVLTVTLTAALLTASGAACSATAAHRAGSTRTVSVAPGVTVRLAAGSLSVRAKTDPGGTTFFTRPPRLDGASLRSAVTVVAPALQLTASGPLPAAGAELTFRLNPHRVPAGTRPFLASLDRSTGKWQPTPSTYNSSTGEISAHVTHFSVWAPLDFVPATIADLLKGALLNLFGVAGFGSAPSCSSNVIDVTDSRPKAGIGACAEADGPGHAMAKIVDERPYPVDLLYPTDGRIDAPAADPFAQLGAAITSLVSNWHDRVLLPGGGEADTTVSLPAGQSTGFVTEIDGEAYLLGILGTAINLFIKVTGSPVIVLDTMVRRLAKENCLLDAARTARTLNLSLASAQDIGSVAFGCVAAVAKGVSDTIFSVASIVASLAIGLIAGVWGAIDSVSRNGRHELTLQRPASCPSLATIKAAIQAQADLGPFTLLPALTCIGPYVSVTAINNAGSGGRVLLEQEPAGLAYLVAGSGPTCTSIRAEVQPGQVLYVPPQYAHALGCLT